jgi:transcriptional regulator with XRE-family HTH domain
VVIANHANLEEVRMPAPKQLDPELSPLHFFGAEFRRAREAAGMSQGAFGATVPCDISTVSRVESGRLTPTDAFIEATASAFPELGLLVRFYRASVKWSSRSGPVPAWFEEWLAAEQAALTLRYWQPIIIPGILQIAEYARALLVATQTDVSDETVEALVSARLARRAIFDRSAPPAVTVVLDEAVLHRLIGSPAIMHEQLTELAELSTRPYLTVQVVPADNGANAGLGGALNIAYGDGTPEVLHMDALEGQTTERRMLVHKAAIAFDRVRGDALPRGQSRELIMRLADELWK